MSDPKLPTLTSFLSTSTLVEDDWDYSWDGIEFNRSDWDIERSFLHQKSVKDELTCPVENCLACKLNPRGFPDSKYYLVYTPSSLSMLLTLVPGASYGDQARDWLYKKTRINALKQPFIVPKTGSGNVFNLKPISGMDMDGIPVYMKEDLSIIQCIKDDVGKFAQNKSIGGSISMMRNEEIFHTKTYEDNGDLFTKQTVLKDKNECIPSSKCVSFLSNMMKQGSNILNYVNQKVESFTANDKPNGFCKVRDSLATLALIGVDASVSVAENLPIAGRLVKSTKKALFKTAKFKGISLNKMESFSYSLGTNNQLSFSFSGKSLNPSYEIGAAKCFKEYINPSVLSTCSFVGSATGALIAAAMALDLNLDTLQNELGKISMTANKRVFGSFSIRSELIKEFLRGYIPENFCLFQNQLCILVTSFPDMKSHMKKSFSSKEELIETLMASLYIPLIYETPVTDTQCMYFSGNFSDDLPILDEWTITVSSASNTANVSPAGGVSSLEDYIGLNWTNDTYLIHSDQGSRDALKYLQSLQNQPITSLFFNKNPMYE